MAVKKICKANIFISLLFIFSGVSLNAAEWQIPVDNYPVLQYDAGTQNWQILEQRNGWIYIANNYGLLEFDGSTWKLYGLQNSTIVHAIEIDENSGDIYAGGTNEFGVFQPDEVGRLQYTSISKLLSQSANFGEVWSIRQIGTKVYFQTNNFIYIYDGESVRSVHHDARMFCTSAIDNALYVGANDGIFVLSGDKLNALRGSERLHNQQIVSMCKYKSNKVLIGTSFDGLYLYDGFSLQPLHTAVDSFLKQNQLFSMTLNEGSMAFGTVRNGIAVTDIDGHNERYINKSSNLQNNTVLCLHFDRQGDLWAGLDEGISLVRTNSQLSLLVDKSAYGSVYSTALYHDNLYLGTNQGIYFTRVDKQLKPLQDLQLLPGSLGQIWKLLVIDDVLYCCHNRGLFVVRSGRLVPIDESVGYWDIKPIDSDRAYAGTYNGIYLLEKQRGEYRTLWKITGFDDTSLHFENDNRANVWVVSQLGLEKLVPSADFTSFERELVHPFNERHSYIDMNRLLDHILVSSDDWCCAIHIGNSQIEADNSVFARLDGEKHYSYIKQDMSGNIWFIADKQLRMRSWDNVRHVYVDESKVIHNNSHLFIDGFPHLNFVDKNALLIGAVNGCNILKNRQSDSSRMLPLMKVYIREASFRSKNSIVSVGQSFNAEKLSLTLPYGNYSLHTVFAGSVHSREPLYSTRLLPMENDFAAPDNLNQREFSLYKEGQYTLQVQMIDSYTGKVALQSFVINILPPWYRTWWARLIWTLITLGFLALVIWVTFYTINADRARIRTEKENEMMLREKQHSLEKHQNEKRILQLEHEKTEYELNCKSQELSNVLLNQVNRNELIIDIQSDLRKIANDLTNTHYDSAVERLRQLQAKLTRNRENDIDWSKFEDNFDMVNGQFLHKLVLLHPWLSKNERKLSVYIHTGLYTKEIAPLMNLSIRGVEMMRYRMRTKMGLDAQANLKNYFIELAASSDPEEVHNRYTVSKESSSVPDVPSV